MITALVTCGGGFQGLGVVRALRAGEDVRTLVCDIHADNPTRYACHEYLVCPPLADAEAFKAFLLGVVKDRHVEFVFPATAHELRTLADLQPALHALGAIAAVSPRPLLDDLLDKQATRRFLATAGLPAEPSIDPRTHDYTFPLIGKPCAGWGARDIVTLASHAEAEAALATLDVDAFAWSRKFDHFDEYSADFAIGANQAISDIVVRQRTRTSGGFAVISESVDDASLNQLFSRLATALADAGGLGCFNAQVIAPRDTEAQPFISDINPRLGTSATHALTEGVNLPGFIIASAQGRATPVTRRPIKNVRLLQELPLPQLARRPHGLVLDLDDTLVDHKRWLFAKMERLHAECFRDHVDASTWRLATAQLIDEHDWPRLIDRTLEVLSLPASLRDRAIDAYRAIEVPTPLFDDVDPALAALADAGIRLAILTDNPPATQRAKLVHAPGLQHIENIVFAREHGGEKPHASAFHAAAQTLGLPPGELAMVGDNWFRDGVGALRAGYANAFVIRREASTGNTDRWRQSATPAEIAARIHVLPDLTCVQHACLDAPA